MPSTSKKNKTAPKSPAPVLTPAPVLAPAQPATPALTPSAAEAAYRALLPQLAALPREKLLVVNVELQAAAVFALGIARVVTGPVVRAQFARLGGIAGYDDTCTEALGPAAQAAWYARHRLLMANATRTEARLPVGLLEEATGLRARMLRLVEYWLGDDARVAAEIAAIRLGTGYQDLANDLIALAAMIERYLAEVSQDRKLYRVGDEGRAKELAGAILEQLGVAATAEQNEWSAIQPRVWTHLSTTYSEVQRGAGFLFAHEGAAERYPSLVSFGRQAATRPAKEAAPEEPAGGIPDSASPVPEGALPHPA